MIERIRDPNVLRVYAATSLLGVAYGIAIALAALHLDEHGFTKPEIGSLAAWFASGIVLFALPMGALIRRFSAKSTLVVATLGYAACVTTFPLLETYPAIAGARFLDGACSVGIWVSSETILLSRADRRHKAFVMSLYAISMSIGYVLGPIAAHRIVDVAPTRVAFLASGFLSLAAAALVAARLERDVHGRVEMVPVDETIGAHPAPAAATGRVGISGLVILREIKTSCFATFAYGYFQSSAVLFLPLFLIESKGVPRDETILVPALFAAGMLLFSTVAGRLGDRFGHLLVMRLLALVGMAMLIGFVLLDDHWLMAIAVFVAGATLASISPVSLALQGVITDPANYSRANSIYNVFYAAGMLVGPPISSLFFAQFGGEGMLLHLAVLWGAFVVFSLVFRRDDPAAKGHALGDGALAASVVSQ